MTRYIRVFSFTFFCIFFFFSDTPAAPLNQLWSNGEVDGTPHAAAYKDVDGDGVKDIWCIKYVYPAIPSSYATYFKMVKGGTFTDLYDWVTPPGDTSVPGVPVDIDQNGTYEMFIISLTNVAANQYQGKITVYNALTGAQIWESSPFSITTPFVMPPFTFYGYPIDLIGTSDNEWVILINEEDPATEEKTARVMVYQKEAGGVGFSQLLWEESYSGEGLVDTSQSYFDLDSDGKVNLTAHFTPNNDSTGKGSLMVYQPSGLSSFTQLGKFEANGAGNKLDIIYNPSSANSLYPTKIDHGVLGGVLLFKEDGSASETIYAYHPSSPFNKIGEFTSEGTISCYPNDCDGDGYDELVINYYNSSSGISNVAVYTVTGGNFTLNKIWETGDTNGLYMVYGGWDLNLDNKVDVGIISRPIVADTSTYLTLTFYQYTGSTFSPLYQFTSDIPGSDVSFDLFETSEVSGPSHDLHIPLDLDCSLGSDLAIASSYQRQTAGTPSQYEQAGKITIYNLPSATSSWESSTYNYYLYAGQIVNVQSLPSNDLLFVGTKNEYTDEYELRYSGNLYLLSCGQTTGTTTTTVPGPSTTTTIGEICPVEEIYGSDSKEAALLRYFRDTILNKSPEGQEITKLYYQLSPVVVEMVTSNENARETVKGIIEGVLALIKSEVE